MKFESGEDMRKRAQEAVNNAGDPDFEKKYEAVKPALELFEKTGYTSEQQQINAERRQAKREKEDKEKIQDIRASLGLTNPELDNEEIIPNYTEVRNEKTGRSILFPKESIINTPEGQETKYVEVKNENNGRSILFSREDIEQAKNRTSIEEILNVPNELANNLKKEEQLLSYINSEISKTQAQLEDLKDTNYIDRVIDQYKDATHAGKELQSEFDTLTAKLKDLKTAESKTQEVITSIENKLSE